MQDQASAFVVAALDPAAGERVYDTCAAPGGKSLLAAERVEPGGAVIAADIAPRRVGLIAETARRLGRRPLLVVQDAAAPAVAGPFDRVLVDAPCSGLGSARRRPELLWRVPKEALAGLAARQLAIVSAAADATAAGGRLVYAVCTFTRPRPTPCATLCSDPGDDLRPAMTEGPDGPAERHRLWPHRHGCDGMFVAAFQRAS